jgi:hypothetical protein
MAPRDATDTKINPDVDTPAAGAETDVAPTETERANATKATRPKLDGGLVSPIEFKNALGKPVAEGGRGVDIRPQIVYSYIRNQAKNDPFPFVMNNGRPGVKLDEALAWWDRKEARKVEREQAKATKAAADAAKAAPAEAESNAPVAEAE